MFNDVFFIVITGFAIIGIYTTIDTLYKMIISRTLPPSVTIMKNDDEVKTYKKVKFLDDTVPNNYTLLYPFDNSENENLQKDKLSGYINEILFTNR